MLIDIKVFKKKNYVLRLVFLIVLNLFKLLMLSIVFFEKDEVF